MVSCQEFPDAAPEFAQRVRARFEAAESHAPARFRHDGSPRVNGGEVRFAGMEPTHGSIPAARNVHGVRRDGRFAFRPNSAGNSAANVASVAAEIAGPPERRAAQGDQSSHLFRLGLDQAVLTEVDDDIFVVTMWRAGRPLVHFERPGNGTVVRIER